MSHWPWKCKLDVCRLLPGFSFFEFKSYITGDSFSRCWQGLRVPYVKNLPPHPIELGISTGPIRRGKIATGPGGLGQPAAGDWGARRSSGAAQPPRRHPLVPLRLRRCSWRAGDGRRPRCAPHGFILHFGSFGSIAHIIQSEAPSTSDGEQSVVRGDDAPL